MEHEGKKPGGVCPTDTSLSLAQAGFVGDSIVDGPGLRCAIFCQGCPHHCPGCHNPGTHAFAGGVATSAEQLFSRIRQHPLCKGITFSGGEPFCQAAGLVPLARRLREKGYELAAYTGYTFEELLAEGNAAQQEFLALLDILVDGRYVEAERDLSLRFRGSRNQRILNVPQSLAAKAPVWESAVRWVGKSENT